ncbi:MAG: hypothetical protein H0U60_17575 [Blastocatellia bacterium]|nr:hypothetical protein [Blastocatellia bacterium]
MRYRLIVLSLLFLWATDTAGGQQNGKREGQRYVIVPNENVLLLIASQPGAPIRFEDTKLLLSIDGRELAVAYKLYNVGTKPIRYLTPMMWTSFGTGGTLTGAGPSSGRVTDELIMPGQTFRDDHLDEIVPLTDELREKLLLRGPMKAIVVLMVQRIAFADGTTYSDDTTAKALHTYFEKLSSKIDRPEHLEHQRK